MIARFALGMLAVIVIAIVAVIRCTPVRADEPPHVDTAIVFLVDTSYSMDQGELEVARRSHVEAFRSAEIQTAIVQGGLRLAVAYVEFGDWAATIVPWTGVDDPASAEAFADALAAVPITNTPGTAIGVGFAEARRLIDTMPYAAARIVVDIVGDGINQRLGTPVEAARNALLDRGVVINGMPLMLAPADIGLDGYYERVVIGGPGAFSMPLTSIDQMPAALRQKIVQELY